MVVIAERYNGQVSVTQKGEVNIKEGTFPTIHLAIHALLSLNQPKERIASEQLRRNFHSVFPNFSSVVALKQPIIEGMAETAEDNLRTLGFIKPVNINTTHPLKNQLIHVYRYETKEKHNPLLIETRLISTWLQFLQGTVEEKKDLSPLSYLTLGSLIQVNYLNQVERLITQISKNPGIRYSEVKETHELLKTVSRYLLNPHILYSQPFKQTAENLQQEINRIEDPGTFGYDHFYIPGIKKAINTCLVKI